MKVKKVFYNPKKNAFEWLQSTHTDYKIEISKPILDANIIHSECWTRPSGETVYASRVGGHMFYYTKTDEILLPEYSNGTYRVSADDGDGLRYPFYLWN